jgi:hypothetical protein
MTDYVGLDLGSLFATSLSSTRDDIVLPKKNPTLV